MGYLISKFTAIPALILGVIAAFFAGGFLGERKGRRSERKEIAGDALEDSNKRIRAGREAVRSGRGDDAADRLRKNDGFW